MSWQFGHHHHKWSPQFKAKPQPSDSPHKILWYDLKNDINHLFECIKTKSRSSSYRYRYNMTRTWFDRTGTWSGSNAMRFIHHSDPKRKHRVLPSISHFSTKPTCECVGFFLRFCVHLSPRQSRHHRSLNTIPIVCSNVDLRLYIRHRFTDNDTIYQQCCCITGTAWENLAITSTAASRASGRLDSLDSNPTCCPSL